MDLINYLNKHFITRRELLEQTKVTEQVFEDYQAQGIMPKASYRLDLNLTCDSFFGIHNESQALEYYAKGYTSWLTLVHNLNNSSDAYLIFAKRYEDRIGNLMNEGHVSKNDKINAGLALHIEEEWTHFQNGIYGLCTKSGLPEDVAAKELAIIEINELIDKPELELKKLERAVNLLDSVSSLFAPHERLKSSRHRLIDEVRRNYKLSQPIGIN